MHMCAALVLVVSVSATFGGEDASDHQEEEEPMLPALADDAAPPAAATPPAGAATPPLSRFSVVVDPRGPAADDFAARQLAIFLGIAAGSAPLPVVSPRAPGASPGTPVFVVGPAAAVATGGLSVVELHNSGVRDDGFFCSSSSAVDLRQIMLTGGVRSCWPESCNQTAAESRGTINAVFEYLQMLGFRFLSINTTVLPPLSSSRSTATPVQCNGVHNPSFSFRMINAAFFPYRAYTGSVYWPGSDEPRGTQLTDRSLYAVANHFNGAMDGGELPGLPGEWGGAAGGAEGYNIAGFVHTSSNIVPPSTYPGWYGGSQQLCWSNASLVAFIAQKVEGYLDAFAAAHGHSNTLVSVTQEDTGGDCPKLPHGKCFCQTDEERAVIAEEGGSPMGPMLRAINSIALAVATKHPQAVIETLAYDYTMLPPNLTRPAPNVNIFFCLMGETSLNITVSHALLLTDRRNSEVMAALHAWSKIMPRTGNGRLKVWNYVENFDNEVVPVPNWRVLGRNIQILHSLNVSGYFGEANQAIGGPACIGQTCTATLTEMRTWVQMQLLWNASRDTDALIQEYLEGFYSAIAAPYMLAHIEAWEIAVGSVSDWPSFYRNGGIVECECPISCPGNCYAKSWVSIQAVVKSVAALATAMKELSLDTANKPYLSRVEKVLLGSWWIMLMRWDDACSFATSKSIQWPLAHRMNESLASWFDRMVAHRVSMGPGICPFKDPTTGQCWNASSYLGENTTGRVCQLPKRSKTDDDVSTADITVFTADSMSTVFRNSTLASVSSSPTLDIARNEFEAIQMVVRAGTFDATQVKVDVTPLTAGGPTVTVNPLGWVHSGPCAYDTAGVQCPHDTPLFCRNLTKNGSSGCGGKWYDKSVKGFEHGECTGCDLFGPPFLIDQQLWYPWVLLPTEGHPSTTIASHTTQSFLLTFHATAKTAAGEFSFQATVNLASGGAEKSIKIVVKVQNFTLPTEVSRPSIWGLGEREGGSGAAKDAKVPAHFNTTQFHDFLLDHRIPVTDMYEGSGHFPSIDGTELSRLWERGQRLWMPMSHFGASGLDEYGNKHGVLGYNESFLQRWCDEANKTIDRALDAGWKMENLLMYAYDEPGLSQMPGLEQLSHTIKRNFPDIKLATCGTNQWQYYLGEGNASMGDGTGNGTVPIPASDGRLKHVDIIIPRAWEYSANWSDPTCKSRIEKARSAGKRIGWYVSGVPVGVAGLNWYLESPPLAARLMAGVAAVKQESDALLYYSLNDWKAYIGTAGVQNVSETLEVLDLKFNDNSSGDGEGMILLPSPSGTLSTVIFENIRDGLEDLEWYSYLDRLVAQARSAGLHVDAEAKLCRVPDELFDHVQWNRGPYNFTYSTDPRVLRRQRSMVAAAIASIQKKMDI